MELDKFDRLIVESLHHNARLSGAELARRVNLSAPAVAEPPAQAGARRGDSRLSGRARPRSAGQPDSMPNELTLARADYLCARKTRWPACPSCWKIHRVTGDADGAQGGGALDVASASADRAIKQPGQHQNLDYFVQPV